ncbi:MAG TPA: PAS domain-containing sensor histidine kinase [Syntrophorhabdaceae bacterium]
MSREKIKTKTENEPPINLGMVTSILNALPMGILVLNEERKIQWLNERASHRFHISGEFPPGEKDCYSEIFNRNEPCPDCPALKTFKSGRTAHEEIKSEYHGEVKYHLVTTTPLRKERTRGQSLIIETFQDITFAKRAEEELRRLNDFNGAIIDNAPVAIFTIDKSGKFMSVNPALAILSGLGEEAEEKLVGLNWLENPYTVRCGLAGHIKKGLEGVPFELQDFPFITYRADRGQYIHFRGVPLKGKDGKVEGLLCIIEDSTEKVKAQIQSIQDAKMSVIGGLMTGVAHELNNPLAAIAANSELAGELFQNMEITAHKEEMEELRGYLDVIEEQAFRCKHIIKDMIDLTKKDGFEVNDVDLPGLIGELLEVLNFRKLKICLIKDMPVDLPCVRGDINALKQCFLNILQNAADALEGREGAVIGIKARHLDGSINVEIEDNGVGIHDGLVDKIFEPFFSTKQTGKGVGLGLTLCYEFLKRMGADIEVKSILGKGSIFSVRLPVSEILMKG